MEPSQGSSVSLAYGSACLAAPVTTWDSRLKAIQICQMFWIRYLNKHDYHSLIIMNHFHITKDSRIFESGTAIVLIEMPYIFISNALNMQAKLAIIISVLGCCCYCSAPYQNHF